ncbi:MAG: AMP-binding protein [candidate division NC10 bacterium]|nr:AMP-binding protein [candidate division NC10 bacterium]
MKKRERTPGFYDEALETMPQEERAKYQDRWLRELVEHAFQYSPAVREEFEAAQVRPEDVRTVGDLQRLPVIKKAELGEIQRRDLPFGGLLGLPISELRRIFVSPGPIYDPEGREASYWRWEKAFYAAGFRKGDIVQNCFGYHLSPGGRMFEEALVNLGCPVIPAGPGNTELQVKVMHDLQVTGYVGTPSFLLAIVKRAEELGYDFRRDFSLEVALVAAEMLPESLRNELEQKYGVIVRQGYGSADAGALGYECKEKSGMHTPEGVIIEVLDPETGKVLGPGETGEVVVTIFNKVYPLIRFGTGDLSFYTDELCLCGRTSPRLIRILGRVDEVTKVRGMFVHPRQVNEVISKFPAISRYQVVVTREKHLDEMTFRLELGEGAPDKAIIEEELNKVIRDLIKLRANIEFVPQGTIPEGEKRIVDKRKWE